jgi:ceramide glucosyltransferase
MNLGLDFGVVLGVIAAWLGALWFVAAVGFFWLTSLGAFLQPRLQERRATNAEQPPVSAILPIKLVNPGFAEAEASILAQHYPQYEVLFGTAEAASPAIDIAHQLMQAHSDVPARILQSPGKLAVSPKLNALAVPLAEAAHDHILTKDSNIVFDPESMAAYMRNLTEDVGLVVGVPIAERPVTIAGHIEALLINGHARLLMTASALGLGFGVGKAMLFRRSDLARAGGLEAIAYTIAEDTALSKSFAALGLKTVFAHKTLRQIIGWRTLREIYDRQLRWSVIRRTHEPFTYPLEPLASPLPAAIAAAIAAPLIGVAAGAAFALTLIGWFVCEIFVMWLKGWEVSALSPIAFIGRELLALTAWLCAWVTKDVTWADSRLAVFNGANGAQGAAPESPLSLHGEQAGVEKL